MNSVEEERRVLNERDDRSKPMQHPSLRQQKSILPSVVSQYCSTVYMDPHHKPKKQKSQISKTN